jgi:hypothetical protein
MQRPRSVLILSGRIRAKLAKQLRELRVTAESTQVQRATALQIRLSYNDSSFTLVKEHIVMNIWSFHQVRCHESVTNKHHTARLDTRKHANVKTILIDDLQQESI